MPNPEIVRAETLRVNARNTAVTTHVQMPNGCQVWLTSWFHRREWSGSKDNNMSLAGDSDEGQVII